MGRQMAENQCALLKENRSRADCPDKKQPGLYAARVSGRPPPDVIEAIESKGGTYRPRDEVEE
jgi:hypothetical protein